ncbi:amino acid adenylation domain-containing protein [Chitinophaga sp. RAB17]|uniref:amino acid adenylation domain-containing protein n=1 Tax=Chitinophaga sp. RAB17 TaxID=3233049 RepID=UPI003F906788
MDKKIIHTVFEERARAHPDNIGIRKGTREVTYGELNTAANRLAHFLRSISWHGDKITGVLMDPGIEQVMSMLAVFKAGVIYLPLSNDFSDVRFRQIFDSSFPPVLIVQQEAEKRIYELQNRIGAWADYLVVMDESYDFTVQHRRNEEYHQMVIDTGMLRADNPELISSGEDGNYIFYTSGSSGHPKAILGKQESLSHFIHWEIKEFGIDNRHRVSQLTQITFDASLRDILTPLCSGGILCIPPEATRQQLHQLIQWIISERISLIHCVPSLFRAITKEMQKAGGTGYNFPDLKYILLAGEVLYARDVLQWRALAGENTALVNLYGATETTLIKVFERIGEVSGDTATVLPVGKPIDNTSVVILNGKNICRPGEIGEIYIKTPFVSKGYYGNESLTKQVFVQNPLVADREDIVYKTGDQGRYLKDKRIEVLGRLDDMIKVNGVRVELSEIEQAVLKKEGIEQAVVKAHKNSDNQQEIICYYTGENVGRDELRAHLETLLNRNILPGYLIQMKEFPLTSNGKIDRRSLTLNKGFLMNDLEFKAPVNDTEVALEKIWTGILGMNKMSRDISFFQVGGHSLRAVQLASRISVELGAALKITDIFSHPTIQQQAELILALSEENTATVTRTGEQQYYDVSNGQLRLWLQHQQQEAGDVYNIPVAYRLKGPLNTNILHNALLEVINRHESTRTTFAFVDGELKQEIKPTAYFSFRLDAIELRSSDDPEAALTKILQEESGVPFDLKVGPLLRFSLYRTGNDEHVLSLTMHHIVCDGWSMEIMFKEIIALYNAGLKKTDPLLPLTTLQYRDYVAWLREHLAQHNAGYSRYWKDQFSRPVAPLQLPADFPRPSKQTFNAAMYAFAVDQDMVAQLREMSLEYEATVSDILLAAFYMLLYIRTGQQEIVVGITVAGREKREWEDMVGFFVNTLPLLVRFNNENTFEQLLSTVKHVAMEAYARQLYPFDSIITDINVPVDRSRNPLFDAGFHFYNIDSLFDIASLQLEDGTQLSELDTGHRSVKSDICLKAVLLPHHLECYFEYNKDIFRESTVASLGEDLIFVLNNILRHPHQQMGDVATSYASHKLNGQETAREHVRLRNLQRLMKS